MQLLYIAQNLMGSCSLLALLFIVAVDVATVASFLRYRYTLERSTAVALSLPRPLTLLLLRLLGALFA